VIQSDTRGNEAVIKGGKRLKLNQRQVVHKGNVKPEAGVDMESH